MSTISWLASKKATHRCLMRWTGLETSSWLTMILPSFKIRTQKPGNWLRCWPSLTCRQSSKSWSRLPKIFPHKWTAIQPCMPPQMRLTWSLDHRIKSLPYMTPSPSRSRRTIYCGSWSRIRRTYTRNCLSSNLISSGRSWRLRITILSRVFQRRTSSKSPIWLIRWCKTAKIRVGKPL